MFFCAITAGIAAFFAIYSFGVMGENVTLRIRDELYSSIIRKNIGWFDDKENAPGILSASMASDTQTINGIASEGLASQV